MIEMIVLSALGSALAYFAFMSSASSAASAQSAAASNWPPTSAQQQALQTQISELVVEVEGHPLTTKEQQNLTQILSAAPAQYAASLPKGMAPTVAGYQAWVMSGTAAQAAANAQTQGG